MQYIIPEEDVVKLADSPQKPMWKVIFRLLFCLGLRTGEVVTIKKDDVDLEHRQLSIIDSKKKRRFVLPIDVKTVELLAEYLDFNHIDEWLFPSNRIMDFHISCRAVCWNVHKMARLSDLKYASLYTPRWFRRYFARRWMNRKGKLTSLKRILRHNRISSTSAYVDQIMFESEVDELHDEYDNIVE